MEYFSEFKWAIPVSYSEALSQCMFAGGDLLYPTKNAYREYWDAQVVRYAIQVEYPDRQRTKPKEDVNEIFKKNWVSEVRVQKYALENSGSEQLTKTGDLIISTQGRLYTAMWKGDLAVLDTSSSEPEMPFVDTREMVRLKEVSPEIKKGGVVIQERVTTNRLEESKRFALEASDNKLVFVMPFDRSNSTSVVKFNKIFKELQDNMVQEPLIVPAEQAMLDEWESYLPTLKIALFIVSNIERKTLELIIKRATYIPVKSKKTDRIAYDMRRHGLVFGKCVYKV